MATNRTENTTAKDLPEMARKHDIEAAGAFGWCITKGQGGLATAGPAQLSSSYGKRDTAPSISVSAVSVLNYRLPMLSIHGAHDKYVRDIMPGNRLSPARPVHRAARRIRWRPFPTNVFPRPHNSI